ncbi:ShlB/FhaC/HecB family hemolysin secretion/activation protein [Winslowiella sp. 2C04]|uniref:ShlB/FhaC/HecB family hemolysin secretion/activation protein n=1 Tax=Winslowiella sp. 2C04 TaxID=3416179 RepID=UPI003CF32F7C
MKSTIKPLLILVALGFSEQSVADVDLNRLIKAQQDIDRSTRQENRVVKKDVWSKVESFKINNIDFPIEEHCIEIDELILNNDFLHDASIKKIKADVAGRCLGSVGVGKLATELQDYFINSGYVTTRIDVPSQDLSTKKLILDVVPGRIESVIIEGNDVRDWILPFKSGEILNVRDIEQGLEVLQKVPGLNVKINIEPGSQGGYSNVLINTGRTKNWNARAWVNNWGDKGTGRNLMGGAGYLYNLTKMNDVFYLSGTTNAEHESGRYNSVSAYYSIPYGYWDYELFYSNSKSRQVINIDPYAFNYNGNSEYLSLKAARTVYRDMDKKVTLSAELLRRKVNYKLEDVELALQKRDMNNVRFGVNFKKNMPGALLDTTLSYQRFLPWLGAEYTPDMDSGDVSRQSNLFNLDVNYTKLLNLPLVESYYELRMGGQYSPDALTLQDQFTIGNRWNVRGFENSAGLYGDSGFYAQNTVNFITGLSNLEWYVGTDYGAIFNDHNSQDSYNNKQLLGATTGLKGSFKSLGYDISLSRPLISPDAFNTDKFTANFNIYYQL